MTQIDNYISSIALAIYLEESWFIYFEHQCLYNVFTSLFCIQEHLDKDY